MAHNYPSHHIDPSSKLPHHDANTTEYLRPKTHADKMVLFKLCLCMALAISLVAGLAYLKHRAQRLQEDTWITATATIEDTRTQVAAMTNSIYGGNLSYEVDVLAAFPVDGTSRKVWIPLSQTPKSQNYARYQAFILKGKQCFVRWNPSHPEQIVAEIN